MNYYIHIPFCRNKCGYCAFYSEPAPTPLQIGAFLDELERRLAATDLDEAQAPETIYLGGGTPSLLSCRELERLFQLLGDQLRPGDATEISMEANPETLTREKIALIRTFVNRLSVGVQSFRAELRKTLERDCTQGALENALEMVRAADFPHWNCDLIYAIPGQTRNDWESDLLRAAVSGADHISCYNLTAEEGARLGATWQISEEDGAEWWRLTGELLGTCGIRRYEISNYARPGAECRHNCNVWRGGLLRGFGPAAASFDGRRRYREPESLTAFLAGDAPETDEIPPEERLNEIFAINLRTRAGWTPELWRQVPYADAWAKRLRKVYEIRAQIPPEWIVFSEERITLSDSGLLFWDSIAELLL